MKLFIKAGRQIQDTCDECGGVCTLGRILFANGVAQAQFFCESCRRPISEYIPRAELARAVIDIDALPLLKDNQAREAIHQEKPDCPECGMPMILARDEIVPGQWRACYACSDCVLRGPWADDALMKDAFMKMERLTPLRVMRLRKLPYEEYLRSDWWKQVRWAMIWHARFKCALCNGGEVLNVHHRAYNRIGCEEPEDLIVLCRDCHEKFHSVLQRLADAV